MLPVLPPMELMVLSGGANTNSSALPVQVPGQVVSHGCPTLKAIEALNRAIAPHERQEALGLALKTFSHSNVNLHDYEMSLGADKSLCLKLGYVAPKAPLKTEELLIICNCLLRLYQCSPEYRKRSFRSIGASEMFPLLVQVWVACLPACQKSHLDIEKENLIRQLTQIFRLYAKLDITKAFFIRYDHGKFLGQIISFVALCLEHPGKIANPHVVLDLVGLIKDLTFRCGKKEKEEILASESRSLESVLFSFCKEEIVSNPKLSELFTSIIWNFVLERSISRQLLLRQGRKDFTVIKFLTRIFSCDSFETKSATAIKIKRNAISAIGNILSDEQNHGLILSDENTDDPLNIMETLIDLVEHDSDSIVRRRAMRTIRCLASSKDQEIRSTIQKQDIVLFLVNTIARNVSHDDENDRDMQIQAFQTVNIMAGEMRCSDWPRLETAILQRIETTTDTKLIIGACKCLVECVMTSPWRRGASCFSDMFWKRLQTTVSTCRDAHASVATLLLEMTKLQKKNDNVLLNEPSSLITSSILETLAELLSASGSKLQNSRSDALEVILLLLNNDANKKALAESEDLLTGLVNFCLLQPGPEKKQSAKRVILELVPEL